MIDENCRLVSRNKIKNTMHYLAYLVAIKTIDYYNRFFFPRHAILRLFSIFYQIKNLSSAIRSLGEHRMDRSYL